VTHPLLRLAGFHHFIGLRGRDVRDIVMHPTNGPKVLYHYILGLM
jgi:hypothetical protein